MWYCTYQKLYLQEKSIIKKDMSVKFYNEKEQLYLETEVRCLVRSRSSAGKGLNTIPKNEAPDTKYCDQ